MVTPNITIGSYQIPWDEKLMDQIQAIGGNLEDEWNQFNRFTLQTGISDRFLESASKKLLTMRYKLLTMPHMLQTIDHKLQTLLYKFATSCGKFKTLTGKFKTLHGKFQRCRGKFQTSGPKLRTYVS
jgi:hypothetical protein